MIVIGDHAQSEVRGELDLAGLVGAEWRVLQPNDPEPDTAEAAVCPTARAGAVYLLVEGRRRLRAHADIRQRLRRSAGTDLLCWLAGPDGGPLERAGVGTPDLAGAEVVVEAAAGSATAKRDAQLRFRPGAGEADPRGGSWDLDGDRSVLGIASEGGRVVSRTHPDPLARLWSALTSPHAGDVVISLADGYETIDWGGTSHLGGGSHGALTAEDSLVPMLTVGLEGGRAAAGEQRRIGDVAALVTEHFTASVPS